MRVVFRGQDTARFSAKRIDASGLSSAERERIAAEVNDSVFFSAKVSDARLLARMQGAIAKAERGESGYNRKAFISKMREEMGVSGGERQDSQGALTDISSSRRLGLIYDFQKQRLDAEVAAAQGKDPVHADNFPALELIREEAREVPRNWRERWANAGGRFYAGRMIALRDAPVWRAISRFGSPLPPFDYNSGMGVIEVPRFELEALGFPLDTKTQDASDERGNTAQARYAGSEKLPEETRDNLPDTPILRKARENVPNIPSRPPLNTRQEAENYTSVLLGGNRKADLRDFTEEQARIIALAIEKAKHAGILDAAKVSKIVSTSVRKGDTAGEIDRKTGEMTLFKKAFSNDTYSRVTPIHEIVHMYDGTIKSNPKLEKELERMRNGYKRAAAKIRFEFPPLSDYAEKDNYEFLCDAVGYYLNGGSVLGYAEKAFVFLQKVIKFHPV